MGGRRAGGHCSGGRGGAVSEIQCIMGNGHMGPPVDRMTDTPD